MNRFHSYIKRPRDQLQAPWAMPDLAKAYGWPSGLKGGGVIAIVELGGARYDSDLSAYCRSLGMPVPSVTDVAVNGGAPSPDPQGADLEVMLDIEVSAAAYWLATGGAPQIRVYWAPNTAGDQIGACVRAAAKDGCDVCSISWGTDEANWGETDGKDMDAAAAEAVAAGMLVFAASGDNDSSDGGDGAANVDLPASAPHVIGCGGTTKFNAPGSHLGFRAVDEVVWNWNPGNADGVGTGGGFSTLFPMPQWQNNAPHGSGRMVPDVAANADPHTGYPIVCGGESIVIGGTSAVAPLYAGLFAAFGRKLGLVLPKLWQNQLSFADISQGDNGQYRAGIGPDPCTGLGVPIAAKLAALFV
jgi:subtilase family serine protease